VSDTANASIWTLTSDFSFVLYLSISTNKFKEERAECDKGYLIKK
jgi:hypothetical protein